MISEQTISNLNVLKNELISESYAFDGIRAYFKSIGHHGFGRFARYEGKERWWLSEQVEDIIECYSIPTYPPIPEATTDYTSNDALAYMLNTDAKIVQLIDDATKVCADMNEWAMVQQMSCIYNKMIEEHNEISMVLNKVKTVANNLCALYEIDKWLYDEYDIRHYYKKRYEEKCS